MGLQAAIIMRRMRAPVAVAMAVLAAVTRTEALAVRTLDGRSVDPFAGPQRGTALVFVHPDCPVSNRYAPELNRLHDEFAARKVALWLVYPGRDDSEATIRDHYRAYAFRVPALRDPDFVLADLAGATMTPEAAVFTRGARGLQRVYRGRIDDRAVRLGVWRATARTRDLAAVLDRLVAGEPLVPFTTQAVGCYIKPLS
jgi:hypothetical protein